MAANCSTHRERCFFVNFGEKAQDWQYNRGLNSHSRSMPYQHKLDLLDSVGQSLQQNPVDIHMYMIQQCCYTHDLSDKHLETGIHQHLQGKQRDVSNLSFAFSLANGNSSVANIESCWQFYVYSWKFQAHGV